MFSGRSYDQFLSINVKIAL